MRLGLTTSINEYTANCLINGLDTLLPRGNEWSTIYEDCDVVLTWISLLEYFLVVIVLVEWPLCLGSGRSREQIGVKTVGPFW